MSAIPARSAGYGKNGAVLARPVRDCPAWFFLGFVVRIMLPRQLSWSKELGALQLVEVGVNLLGRKEPPDFGDEHR